MQWTPDHSKWLVGNELQAVLDYCKEKRKSRDFLFASLLLESGIRVSELCKLRVKNCLLDGNSFLRIEKSKGGKTRNVLIPDKLKKQISEHIKSNKLTSDDFLILSNWGKPYTRFGARKLFMQIVKEATGRKDVSIHGSRHSYASEIYRKSKDLLLVKNQLGHSSLNVSQIYMHADTEQTMNTLNNIFK